MKLISIPLTLILTNIFSTNIKAEESYSFGLGIGPLYNGLGGNIAHISNNEMRYASAGCISYSSLFGSTCGVGLGWIKTDLFESESNKDGYGIYIGTIGSEAELDHDGWDNKPIYGIGVGYHYFFNGIDESGSNLGISFGAGDSNNGTEHRLMFTFGYQF